MVAEWAFTLVVKPEIHRHGAGGVGQVRATVCTRLRAIQPGVGSDLEDVAGLPISPR